MELELGTQLDRYRIEARIGAGGMAIVYRARHRQLGSLHAIKVLTLPDPGLIERLTLEAQMQSRVRHPNIVPVTDFLEVNGVPAVVMELVSGPTLHQLLRTSPPSLAQADVLARGILCGVRAAHEAGLIHRDLKPGNILLEIQEGTFIPRIADFGLVKARLQSAEVEPMTLTGAVMGTPGYMAPEQIRNSRDVDERADLFSLGTILYELVTGQRAFPGTDILDVFNRTSEGRYPTPASLIPHLPNRMVEAIAFSLEPDRTKRVASCEALQTLWCGGTTSTDQMAAGAWTGPELAAVIHQVEDKSHPGLEQLVQRRNEPDIVSHLEQCIPCRVQLKQYQVSEPDSASQEPVQAAAERPEDDGSPASGEDRRQEQGPLSTFSSRLSAEKTLVLPGAGRRNGAISWWSLAGEALAGAMIVGFGAVGALMLMLDQSLSWLGGAGSQGDLPFLFAVPAAVLSGALLAVLRAWQARGGARWWGWWFIGPSLIVVGSAALTGWAGREALRAAENASLSHRAQIVMEGLGVALSSKLPGVVLGALLLLLTAGVTAFNVRLWAIRRGVDRPIQTRGLWVAAVLGGGLWIAHMALFQVGGAPFLVFVTLCLGAVFCAAVGSSNRPAGVEQVGGGLVSICVVLATILAFRAAWVEDQLRLVNKVLLDAGAYRLGSANEVVVAMGNTSWWMMLPWLLGALFIVAISGALRPNRSWWTVRSLVPVCGSILLLLSAIAVDILLLSPVRLASSQVVTAYQAEASVWYFGVEMTDVVGDASTGATVIRPLGSELHADDVLMAVNGEQVANLGQLLDDAQSCLCAGGLPIGPCNRFGDCLEVGQRIPATVLRKHGERPRVEAVHLVVHLADESRELGLDSPALDAEVTPDLSSVVPCSWVGGQSVDPTACADDEVAWCSTEASQVGCCAPGLVPTVDGCDCPMGGSLPGSSASSDCATAQRGYDRKARRALNGQRNEVRQCLNAAEPRSREDLPGVEFTALVAADGTLAGLDWAANGQPSPSIQRCVKTALADVQLDPPPNGAHKVAVQVGFQDNLAGAASSVAPAARPPSVSVSQGGGVTSGVAAVRPAGTSVDDSVTSSGHPSIWCNGKPLSADAVQQYFALVQQGLLFEHYFSFWYDSVSGAYGPWGGGIDDLVTPGLVLCGPLPVNASNGTTGVYINGRQLPHSEWSIFHQALPGGLPQGYYWLDGQANMGRQGQSAFTNLSMQGEWYADEW